MKKNILLLLLIGVSALCGCTHRYIISTSNGLKIDARTKPKLKDGAYYFKDGRGVATAIPAGRVVEIAPASMSQKENEKFKFNPAFNPSASK